MNPSTRSLAGVFAILASGCSFDLGAPVDAAREEITLVPLVDEATCSDPGHVFAAPPALLEHDGRCDPEREQYCSGLAPDLRAHAAAHDPIATLRAAVRAYDERRGDDPDPLARARALADLAVSGRESGARFAELLPAPADLLDAGSPEAVRFALERAYDVAWALRGPPSARAALRPALGWIAVSSEDDLPDRPVNVPAAPFPAADVALDVPLGDGTIRSLRGRVVVASTEPLDDAPMPDPRVGHAPAPWPLTVPADGPILLFLHGHSSLVEEGSGLLSALVERARARGEPLTVVGFDQPSNGYSERLDPSIVFDADGGRDDALLRFLDRTVLAVVEALEAASPGASARVAAVIGGSLGGNLVLRFGEDAAILPAARLVAWSPASIDQSWSRARWPLAAGDGEFVDIVKHEAVRMTRDASEEEEDDGSRAHFFTGGLTSIRHQAGYWYREGWEPCRSQTVEEGLIQLSEVYDASYRRWHYRVAFEQLVFSHLEPDVEGEPRRFRRIARPLLLVTGAEDDRMPIPTYSFVERLAPHLGAPGTTLYLEDTGHALHTERPALLAEQIDAFVLGASTTP